MPMSMQLPQAAARAWSDPAVRQRIVDMHDRGDSLLDMVAALGLDDALDSDGLRDVVANLTDPEVQVIRDAFRAEAQQVGDGPGASFPVDCRVDDATAGVRVSAAPAGQDATTPVARIENR